MDILSVFAETLSELISDTGVTHMDIEKATGSSNGNVSMWLNKKVAPTIPSLIRLSVFFKCSIDYLLGRADTLSFINFDIVSTLPERLKELAKEKNKSIYKIATEFEMDETILYRWTRGEVAPNLNNLVMLANYFNCSVDYLIGRKE